MTKAVISWKVDYEDMVEEILVYRGYGRQFDIDNSTLIATLPPSQSTFTDTDYPDEPIIYYCVIIKRFSLDFISKYFKIKNDRYGLKEISKPEIVKMIDNNDGMPTIVSTPVPEIDHISTDWYFYGAFEDMYIEQTADLLSFTLPKYTTRKSFISIWARVRYSGKNFHTEWSDPFYMYYDPVSEERFFTVLLHVTTQYP